MAQSKLPITNVYKDLKCAICVSDFTEPKLLACLHTFCMTCLKRYCKKIDKKEKPCPLCRTKFNVPQGGVEMLKTDQVKARLVLEKQTREGKQKLSKCDACEGANAEAYCVECMQNICSTCRKTHLRLTHTKLHKIVAMDEKPNEEELHKQKSQFCTIHAGESIKLYCCDCEKLLCYSCHSTKHSKHICKIPSELAQSKCKEFEKDQNRVKICIEEEIKKVNDLIAGPMARVKEITKIEKVVKDTFADMISHLETQRDKLLNWLNKIRVAQSKSIQGEDYVSEFRCAELNSFLEYSRMMMERGTDYEILEIAGELHERAENLILEQENRNERYMSLANLEILAKISSKIEEAKNVVLEMDLLQTQDWNRFLNNSEVRSYISGKSSLFGIETHNDEVYITGDDTPYILVYRLQNLSKVFRKISVPDLTQGRGLVYNESDSCLYVSNFVRGHIYKINSIDNSVTGWAIQTGNPWGLSISKQKNLLVSYLGSGQIDEFNTSGHLIRSIKLEGGITGNYHSIELETGEFIVSYDPQARICLVDSSGKVIKHSDTEGSSGVELRDPMHVKLDQRGNILVSDWGNHKLRVLTSDLKYVADVNITDTQFEYPAFTCWDKENDRLLVTTESNRIFVITPQISNILKVNQKYTAV